MLSIDSTYWTDEEGLLQFDADSHTEFGKVRSAALIRKRYLQQILADPENLTVWETGISSGEIIFVPFTTGYFDSGELVKLKGYGRRLSTHGPRDMSLVFSFRASTVNFDFFNGVHKAIKFVPAFRTSSYLHICDQPADITTKEMAEEDVESELQWLTTCVIRTPNLPKKFNAAFLAPLLSCKDKTSSSGQLLMLYLIIFQTKPVSTTKINLKWVGVVNASGYKLERRLQGAPAWTLISDSIPDGTTQYADEGLAADTTYEYRLTALGDGITYGNSNAITRLATTLAESNETPAAPDIVAYDDMDIIDATHALGDSEILVSVGGGAFVPFDGNVISVGDVDRPYGYYQFKTKAAPGRNESPVAYSPAFTAVIVEINLEYGWHPSDPHASIIAGNGFPVLGSIPINHNQDLTIPTQNMPSGFFMYARVPQSQSDKTKWYNTSFNFGTIDDQIFRPKITIGGYDYYYTRVGVYFSLVDPTILST